MLDLFLNVVIIVSFGYICWVCIPIRRTRIIPDKNTVAVSVKFDGYYIASVKAGSSAITFDFLLELRDVHEKYRDYDIITDGFSWHCIQKLVLQYITSQPEEEQPALRNKLEYDTAEKMLNVYLFLINTNID